MWHAAAPCDISFSELRECLCSLDGVRELHDIRLCVCVLCSCARWHIIQWTARVPVQSGWCPRATWYKTVCVWCAAAPRDISFSELRECLCSLDGVRELRDIRLCVCVLCSCATWHIIQWTARVPVHSGWCPRATWYKTVCVCVLCSCATWHIIQWTARVPVQSGWCPRATWHEVVVTHYNQGCSVRSSCHRFVCVSTCLRYLAAYV